MSDYHQSTTPIKISRQKDKQRLDLFGGANGLNESNESSSEESVKSSSKKIRNENMRIEGSVARAKARKTRKDTILKKVYYLFKFLNFFYYEINLFIQNI